MNGIAPALVTPFDSSGDLDAERLGDLVDWFEERGVNFLVPCGSTGEAPLLTDAERRRVIDTVADAASVPVLAGTGHPGLRATTRATRSAAAAGADAALAVTPYYYVHGQDGLAGYYTELAEAADVPIYPYSVPKFTGVSLEVDTVVRLAEKPAIAGMKDSSGDFGTAMRILRHTRTASFDLLLGDAGVLDPALARGAAGGILGIANVVPGLARDVARAEVRPAEAHDSLCILNEGILGRFGIPGIKYAMRVRGAPAGHPRSPLRPLDESARERIDRQLRDADVV